MGLDDEALKAHGLLFDDGDLLTDSLKEKASVRNFIADINIMLIVARE
jgi:hypothetical protein